MCALTDCTLGFVAGFSRVQADFSVPPVQTVPAVALVSVCVCGLSIKSQIWPACFISFSPLGGSAHAGQIVAG